MRRMFSEKQIQKIVKEVVSTDLSDIDLVVKSLTTEGISCTGDAEITGDLSVGEKITAKVMDEKGDTALLDLKQYLLSSVFKDDTKVYAKAMIKHHILHVVVSGQYVAGASAGSNPIYTDNIASIFSEAVLGKIYRADGTNITEAPTSNQFTDNFICGGSVINVTSGGTTLSRFVLRSTAANTIDIIGFGAGSIAEDANCDIDLRIQLTL